MTNVLMLAFICLIISPHSSRANIVQTDNNENSVSEIRPSICLSVFEVSENSTGCLVAQSKTFKEASKFCIANNMTLYEISSRDELQGIYNNAIKYFSTGGGTIIWINGKWSARAEAWYLYPQHESFHLTEIFSDKEKYKGIHGRCLAIESAKGTQKYEIFNFSCDIENYFYCKI